MKKYAKILLSLILIGCYASGCSTTSDDKIVEENKNEKTDEVEENKTVEVEYRQIDLQKLIDDGAVLTQATVYGIYEQVGDSIDSCISTTVYTDENQNIVLIQIDEALIPYSTSGAEGWALLNEEELEDFSEAVVATDKGNYAKYFTLNDVNWSGEEVDGQIIYTNDEGVNFMDYIATQEGGEWYFNSIQNPAQLLDYDGNVIKEVTINTKASIEHGVSFWPSSITFPGNIELIKNYVYDHGVDYGYYPESSDIQKNEQGSWVVLDTTTNATLAGAPNYFNLIKKAFEKIEAGEGIPVSNN